MDLWGLPTLHKGLQAVYDMILYNMKTIAITIEADMLARIDAVAEKRGHSVKNRSRFIREAIHDYLLRTERAMEEEREREIFSRNKGKLKRQALALIKEQAKQ